MERVILHCDCNSFYASVELLDYPALQNVPVAVCGDPKSRHGIILAKNEPAKQLGVKTAETIWQAKQKAPGLVTLPPHHDLYAKYSRRVNEIYGQYTDLVEPFGIDESWLDVTDSATVKGDGYSIAKEISNRMKSELGITVSIGVSFNKIFAKLNLIALAIAKKLKVDRFDFAKRMIREKVYECFDVPNNLIDLYKRMCKDFGVECKIDGNLYMEDAVLLCILRECVSEMAIKMDIRHIVIDEVQEYPILFIDFLLRNFGRAQFSMFGDKYQRTNPVGIDDLEQIVKLNAIWGDSKLYTLDNTYRSSEEIVEYSSKIIGSPRHNVFRYSNGQAVEEVLMGDDVCQVVSQVAMILEKIIGNKGTIGIIVGDDEFGQEFYNELSKICPHRVSFIKNAEDEACGQVQILPVILSKGLEFDTVIVIENGGLFNSELGTNLRYIACTRAINKLYVLKHKD